MASILTWAGSVLDSVDSKAETLLTPQKEAPIVRPDSAEVVFENSDSARGSDFEDVALPPIGNEQSVDSAEDPPEAPPIHVDVESVEVESPQEPPAAPPAKPRVVTTSRRQLLSSSLKSLIGHRAPPTHEQTNAEVFKLQAQVVAKQEEVDSLRAVWNESRQQTDRLHDLLHQKDALHERKVGEVVAEWENKLALQHAEHQEEILELKRLVRANQVDFDLALQVKEKYRSSQDAEMNKSQQRLHSCEEELKRMQERIEMLEKLRQEHLQQQQETEESHRMMLARLRDEYQRAEQEVVCQRDQHAAVMSSQLQERQTREYSLEEDREQYVKALVTAEGLLEEKRKELSRVQTERRWLEADQSSLKQQLELISKQLEEERSSSSATLAKEREHNAALTTRLACATEELTSSRAQLKCEREAVAKLEARLGSADRENTQQRVAELERRLKDMASHLLTKQTQLEQKVGEISALRHELASVEARERAQRERVSALERLSGEWEGGEEEEDEAVTVELGEAKLGLRARTAVTEAVNMPGSVRPDHIHFNRLNNSLAARLSRSGAWGRRVANNAAAARAVGCLDSFGQFVGRHIRRKPLVRLAFALYVILLHVWVMYVIFHFAGHAAPPPAGLVSSFVDTAGPPQPIGIAPVAVAAPPVVVIPDPT